MSVRQLAVVVSILCSVAVPVVAAELVVSDASGHPGETATVTVSLNAQGGLVAGTQNQIRIDGPVQFAVRANGKPDCTIGEGIFHKPLSAGCMPGINCTGILILILGTDDVDPIADGIVYTCNLRIDANTQPGDYPLICDGTILSDPSGEKLPNASCRGGTVTVLPPSPPELVLSNVTAHPGETVTFDVRLAAHGTDVIGTQNDIAFGPEARVDERSIGRANCTFDEMRNRCLGSCTYASLGPHGCNGTACEFMRALILPLDLTDLIPDGTTVYSCDVAIAPDTSPGRYPLLCTDVYLSDSSGNEIPGAGCRSSVVTVLPNVCPGDCDADGHTTIDELVTGINIAQDVESLDACTVLDTNSDTAVTVEELVAAFNSVLYGCAGN